MCRSNQDDEKPGNHEPVAAGQTDVDFSKVLIVATSPVNRIVVSGIVERCGLKPLSIEPDAAAQAVHALAPGIVILDGIGHNDESDSLFGALETIRQAADGTAPRVILLSTHADTPTKPGISNAVDAVVMKPIMPERLQPVIVDLVALSRR